MSLTEEDRAWITQLLTTEREFTVAAIERVETSLLTEFHKWASPQEMRLRSHTAALRAFDSELEFVSDRVTKLEGR